MTVKSDIPLIELNDGNTIPQLGFGVFQIEPNETVEAVLSALEVGYRHIDTAEMYGNEREVGEAIRQSGLDRDDVYVTSKLNNGAHRPDDARRAFDGTLEALGFDHVDLFLVHWPLPTLYDGDFVSTWKAMEEFKADGRARSIGVSNFQPEHLERLAAETDTVPAVNQIELHPYFQNREVAGYDEQHGIATEAWSPIAQGEVLDDPTIGEIAEQARPHAGPGGAALAHPARLHRLPEVGDARAHQGELRALRLRARPGRHASGSTRSTGARPAATARTRSASTTSPRAGASPAALEAASRRPRRRPPRAPAPRRRSRAPRRSRRPRAGPAGSR